MSCDQAVLQRQDDRDDHHDAALAKQGLGVAVVRSVTCQRSAELVATACMASSIDNQGLVGDLLLLVTGS